MSEGHFTSTPGAGAPDLAAMSPGEAARFGVALCDALRAAMPERGFHGAVYPANLHMDSQGKLTLGPPLELKPSFTPEELEYLPPELFWNGVGGPATDVCAVGLLLYAACSGGRPAFTGDAGELTPEKRATAVQRRMKGETLRPPREAGDELSDVILRAAAFREEERWPDLESLRGALEDCSVFSAPVPRKLGGADVLAAAAVSAAATASVLGGEKPAVQPAAPAEPAPASPRAAAPAPRPVAPGAKNSDVVVPAPERPKPAKPEPPRKPKTERRKPPAAPQADPAPTGKRQAQPETAPQTPSGAKPKNKPETKPEAKPGTGDAAPRRPAAPPPTAAKKGRDRTPPVPDGRPRPVFDAANEKKNRKRSPLPVVATIVALVVILLAVLYFVKGDGDAAPPTESGLPGTVSPAADPTPAGGSSPNPTPSADPAVTPTPEATPVPKATPSPMPESTPTPAPALSVTLAETGSASWDEAAALCIQQGGHLPVVRGQDDLTALITAAEAQGVSYVWLDAQRGTDGVWRTSAGEEVTFFQWFSGEPSGTDTDGTAENYLMLWKYNGIWGYNDMRSDPGTAYSRYYGGRIAVFCQND